MATESISARHFQHSAGHDDLDSDVVSQFPFLNGYTSLLCGFQLAPDASRENVKSALRDAIRQLTTLIPWLSSQVVHVAGRDSGSSGTLRMAPWPKDSTNEMVRFKDCDDLIAPMEQMIRAGTPISMLDGLTLTPWPSLPRYHGIEGPVPVVALQVNFVQGGLIVDVNTHHTIMDATGIMQLLRMLAIVLSGRDIPAEELVQANRDRGKVVTLIPRGEPVKDFNHLRRPPGFVPAPPASPPEVCYFMLPLPSLNSLMKLAACGSPTMLSENDVICAFYWQRISAARLARGYAPESISKFGRAIDGRPALGVPFTYMGHMVCHAAARLPLHQVLERPLSKVAEALRRELNAANTPWAVRSYVTFLAREPDRSGLLYGGIHNPNIDIGSTSSIVSVGDARDAAATMPSSWGSLGEFKFLRSPKATPVPGAMIVYPAEGRAIPILVCLPVDDLEALKKDKVWRQYTRFLG